MEGAEAVGAEAKGIGEEGMRGEVGGRRGQGKLCTAGFVTYLKHHFF